MKKTYIPSIEEIDRQHGERYYTVTASTPGHKSDSATAYGTLEDLVSTADAYIFSAYGDAADLDRYSLRISYAGRDIVHMPDLMGPDSAQVMPQPVGDTYELRQVDALAYDDGWTYNETYHLDTFTTTGDVSRAMRRVLARLGVTFYRGRTRTEYDGSVYEIVDRKTGEPLFVAIPQEV